MIDWPALPFSREALLVALNGSAVWCLLPLVAWRRWMTARSYLITMMLFFLNIIMTCLNFSSWLGLLK